MLECIQTIHLLKWGIFTVLSGDVLCCRIMTWPLFSRLMSSSLCCSPALAVSHREAKRSCVVLLVHLSIPENSWEVAPIGKHSVLRKDADEHYSSLSFVCVKTRAAQRLITIELCLHRANTLISFAYICW